MSATTFSSLLTSYSLVTTKWRVTKRKKQKYYGTQTLFGWFNLIFKLWVWLFVSWIFLFSSMSIICLALTVSFRLYDFNCPLCSLSMGYLVCIYVRLYSCCQMSSHRVNQFLMSLSDNWSCVCMLQRNCNRTINLFLYVEIFLPLLRGEILYSWQMLGPCNRNRRKFVYFFFTLTNVIFM